MLDVVDDAEEGTIQIITEKIESAVEIEQLVVLQFKAHDDAQGSSRFGLDINKSSWNCEGCFVSVLADEKQALICSDEMTAIVGESAEIPIKICNNPGLLGFCLKVSYDKDIFAVDDVAAGNAWNGLLEFNDNGEGQIDVLGTATSEISEDGILITLKLLVKDDAPLGDTQIAIAVDSESTFDGELNELSFQVENSLITIADYGEVILAKGGSSTVIKNGFIYGLTAGCTSLNDYVEVKEGFTLEYDTSARIGTGLTVKAKRNDLVVENCTVIIFGDLDGNGWYDGTDAYFVRLVTSGMIPQTALTEAQLLAADANHDGVIDSADVALLEQAGLLLAEVDQVRTHEEPLETNSAYVEYLSLIDQSVKTEAIEDDTGEEATVEEPQSEPDKPAQTEEAQTVVVSPWYVELFQYFAKCISIVLSIFF